MIIELISLAYLVGREVYHRLKDKPDVKADKAREIQTPRVDNGAPVSLIYGKCRVRSPILAWNGVPSYGTNGISPAVHQLDQFFVLGAGFAGGTNVVHGMWQGDHKFKWGLLTGALGTTQTGDGALEEVINAEVVNADDQIGGYVETLNGKPTQTIVNDAGTATTYTGLHMLVYWPASSIPAYRGVISAFLHGYNTGQWRVGNSGSVPSYSFEVSSYKDTGMPAVGNYARSGDDSSPVNVLYDLITAYLARAGVSTIYIDSTMWDAAAITLYQESHGISLCIDDVAELGEHIERILKQIDAVMYERSSDGKLCLKLVRSDYDPNAIPVINKDNCDDLQGLSMSGHANLVNKVRVVYTSREHGYVDRDEVAQNMANAAGQSGLVNEIVLQFPGVTHSTLAKTIASRELAWRCKPMIKCRAIVDRSFIRTEPGDVVRIYWSAPDISGLVFRVGAVDRGTLEDGKIALDLISDASFVWRNRAPRAPNYGVPGLRDIGIGTR